MSAAEVWGLVQMLVVVLLVANIALAIVTLFLERRDPASLWAWILVMTLLPVVGFILYVFIGRRLTRAKVFKLLSGTRTDFGEIANNQRREISSGRFDFQNVAAADYAGVTELLMADRGSQLTQDNDVAVFHDGREKFDALLADIRSATDHCHVLYYIFRADELGMSIIDAMAERAEAGVDVRLCFDAMGGKSVKKRHLARLRAAGGQIYPFFPNKIPLINFRINNRTHRKMVVIDGRVGYVGGFNVGNEYLGLDKKFGYWRDTHLRVEGGAVAAIQRRFLMDWNAAADQVDTVAWESRFFPTVVGRPGDTALQIVSSGPDSQWERIKFGYLKMINSAKESIWIQTPYFMPDAAVLAALEIAARSGIDVQLMIPDKPDHLLVYPATLSYADELAFCGARIYIYGGGFLHAKTILIDGRIGSVGTANFDYRSFGLNFEVNAFFYDDALGRALRTIFEHDLQSCTLFDHDVVYRRPVLGHLKEGVSRLVAPLL
ncbi:MAG: cardiolipin synthase [Propionibacteriaceae bacterium]